MVGHKGFESTGCARTASPGHWLVSGIRSRARHALDMTRRSVPRRASLPGVAAQGRHWSSRVPPGLSDPRGARAPQLDTGLGEGTAYRALGPVGQGGEFPQRPTGPVLGCTELEQDSALLNRLPGRRGPAKLGKWVRDRRPPWIGHTTSLPYPELLKSLVVRPPPLHVAASSSPTAADSARRSTLTLSPVTSLARSRRVRAPPSDHATPTQRLPHNKSAPSAAAPAYGQQSAEGRVALMGRSRPRMCRSFVARPQVFGPCDR